MAGGIVTNKTVAGSIMVMGVNADMVTTQTVSLKLTNQNRLQ